MKHLSLAARYRPQTFADVAGQPLAAVALSRAAAEDKVAPAYLLSGTRGVGKTTIARIFAKALNCQSAPAPEPCNACPQCQHITAGNHVDVSEIDAASNTGVDDVRALRETIGFMPMEGRYKIFIVDEAHMLSKNAFNALLKTLEEPPSHTVFIFATTEAHRFPATIISRCQHFVFRHLPERAIRDHLVKVLGLERVEFEEEAVNLLAKRAAGSVRDSLSLLDQTLALANGKLAASQVREALGVAGPELFGKLFDSIAACDCAQIMDLSGDLLASGVDVGFFARELGAWLRNLFLTRQTNGAILQSLSGLTDDEKTFLKAHAAAFSAAHLHAGWQMALESQRGIAQSPEPGAALELLLLNLALLPQLLPVGATAPRDAMPGPLEPARPAPKAPTAKEQASATAAKEQASPAPPAAAQAPAKEAQADPVAQAEEAPASPRPEDWKAFCEFCRAEKGQQALAAGILNGLDGNWKDGVLRIIAPTRNQWERVSKNLPQIKAALARYSGKSAPEIDLPEPGQPEKEEKAENLAPELLLCKEILGASIKEYTTKNQPAADGANNEKHE